MPVETIRSRVEAATTEITKKTRALRTMREGIAFTPTLQIIYEGERAKMNSSGITGSVTGPIESHVVRLYFRLCKNLSEYLVFSWCYLRTSKVAAVPDN